MSALDSREIGLAEAAYKAALGRIVDEEREAADKLKAEQDKRMQQMREGLIADLDFERAQLGRGGMDREIAARLRSAGLAPDLGSAEAAWVRYNLQLERSVELIDDIRGGTKSFIAELLGGIRRGEPLEALERGLERLAEGAEARVAQGISDAFLGPEGSAGSGLFGGWLSDLAGRPDTGCAIGDRGCPRGVGVVASLLADIGGQKP
jgi:hypothetical protein